MNEFLDQFITECTELVEQTSRDLLALEENPGDSERLDGALRGFHTLKGSAAIVDFERMVKTSHAVEDLLSAVKSGQLAITRVLIGDCLATLDLIVQWLDRLRSVGEVRNEADPDADSLLLRLWTHLSADGATPGGPSKRSKSPELDVSVRALLEAQVRLLKETDDVGSLGRLMAAAKVAVNVLKSSGQPDEAVKLERVGAECAANEDSRPLWLAIEALLATQVGPLATVNAVAGGTETAARVLRVDVERIDAVVRLAGELTVAKNSIGHIARLGGDPKVYMQNLRDHHAVLDRLVGELQRSVLAIRVLPLRFVFQRFPRSVREMAENLGKSVRLVMEGDETEADKVIVENLFEPLLHIVRNALDHGIEPPAEREEAGKPPVANLILRAHRRGDEVVVEVHDDGRGIDIERVRRIATERGIVDAKTAGDLTDRETIDLIFAPGFSTSTEISDISGRGVGMDIVRTNVERFGGHVEVSSDRGIGTRVTLHLPFSIMITRVLTVMAAGQTFGLPLDTVTETVRIGREQISALGTARAFVLRDRTIPIIDLGQALGGGPELPQSAVATIAVVNLAGALGGVEVDGLGTRMDVMLKPAEGLLSGIPAVAGTSLLGDGSVLIVLDLYELLK